MRSTAFLPNARYAVGMIYKGKFRQYTNRDLSLSDAQRIVTAYNARENDPNTHYTVYVDSERTRTEF